MSEHLPIQRWGIRHVAGDAYIDKESEGSWITYPDHLAALRDCEEQMEESMDRSWEKFSRDQFDAGYAAALDAAREQVKLLILGQDFSKTITRNFVGDVLRILGEHG